MDNNNEQQDTTVLVGQAMADFRKGMEYREQPGICFWRCNTQIMRFA